MILREPSYLRGLALEALEPDAMRPPPRQMREAVLGRRAVERIGLMMGVAK